MSASEVASQIRLPNDLNYELPSSLPSSKNSLIVCQPINGSSFSGQGSVIQLDIPCQRNSYMLNPHFRYKSVYTIGAGDTPGTDLFAKLGTNYAPFITQTVFANNSTIIEQIQEAGQIANFIFRSTMNDSELKGMDGFIGCSRDSTEATAYACSTNVGHIVNGGAGIQALTFDGGSPLIGILNSDKLFPLCKLNSLRLELTLDATVNFVQGLTAQAVTSGATLTISDFEFCFNSVTLGDQAQMMIDQALGGEKLLLRSRSWKYSTGVPLAAQTGAGTYQIQCGIRASSLCGLIMTCQPAGVPDKKFGSVIPNLTQGSSFLINGVNHPQRTLDPMNKPSQLSSQLQSFWGGLNSASHSGSFGKTASYRSSTGAGLLLAYNATIANVVSAPNHGYFVVDTEIMSKKSDVLLAGINVDTPIFFNAVVGAQLANASHAVGFHGLVDVILSFDLPTKSCVALY